MNLLVESPTPRRVTPVPKALVETDWLSVEGLEKAQTERLLDWLEGNGYERGEVILGPDGSCVVRYRPRTESPRRMRVSV
jgi:hypothetical protein